MTTGVKQASNVAIASLPVDTDQGTIHVQDALIDTGASRNLASRHLLKDIRLAKSYGNEPIRMVTVNGLSPDYSNPLLRPRTAYHGPRYFHTAVK
jgi:hypothetical protein